MNETYRQKNHAKAIRELAKWKAKMAAYRADRKAGKPVSSRGPGRADLQLNIDFWQEQVYRFAPGALQDLPNYR